MYRLVTNNLAVCDHTVATLPNANMLDDTARAARFKVLAGVTDEIIAIMALMELRFWSHEKTGAFYLRSSDSIEYQFQVYDPRYPRPDVHDPQVPAQVDWKWRKILGEIADELIRLRAHDYVTGYPTTKWLDSHEPIR